MKTLLLFTLLYLPGIFGSYGLLQSNMPENEDVKSGDPVESTSKPKFTFYKTDRGCVLTIPRNALKGTLVFSTPTDTIGKSQPNDLIHHSFYYKKVMPSVTSGTDGYRVVSSSSLSSDRLEDSSPDSSVLLNKVYESVKTEKGDEKSVMGENETDDSKKENIFSNTPEFSTGTVTKKDLSVSDKDKNANNEERIKELYENLEAINKIFHTYLETMKKNISHELEKLKDKSDAIQKDNPTASNTVPDNTKLSFISDSISEETNESQKKKSGSTDYSNEESFEYKDSSEDMYNEDYDETNDYFNSWFVNSPKKPQYSNFDYSLYSTVTTASPTESPSTDYESTGDQYNSQNTATPVPEYDQQSHGFEPAHHSGYITKLLRQFTNMW